MRPTTKGIDDLETLHTNLAKEWHPTLNGDLRPRDVMPGSSKKVYWQCSKCNHVWEAKIRNRAILGRGCPCCANKAVVKGINDLATTHPAIAKEWYQPLNGDITPYDVTHGCGKKYSWLCPRGHIYAATVLHRTSGQGTNCPVCNRGRHTSFAEQALFYYVRKVFPNAINGYQEIFTNGMELDIYIPDIKTGIEYDGVYWHHKKASSFEREQRKYDICKEHEIMLIRVREKGKHDDVTPAADWCVFLSNVRADEATLNQAIESVINKITSISCKTTSDDSLDIDINRDRYEILASLQGPVKNSIQEVAPELVEEWDDEKNGELKPNMIAGGSTQPINWICSTCGYNWVATPYHRVKDHTGCPKCAGFVFEKGINDLETKVPELLIDWDYEENAKNGIYPNEIMFNSGKKVNWKCHICGHKWIVALNKRSVSSNGCIKCGYKDGIIEKHKKRLEKQGGIVDPLLLKEWDYDRNNKLGLFPNESTPGSTQSVYWICSKCGYNWKAPIARRSHGAGCRKCADKANPALKRKRLIEKGKAITNELLLKEWDYQRNTASPQEYTIGSKVKAFWICSKCGYSWSAAIHTRVKGSGCPACAGQVPVNGKNDLATMRPELAKEWDYAKNKDVNPSQVTYSSGKKYWWICPEGHESYLATPSHRIHGTGCPICGSIRIAEKSRRQVDQLSLDGIFIRTYNSIKAAAETCNVSNGAISNAIRKNATSGGYRWRYHVEPQSKNK